MSHSIADRILRYLDRQEAWIAMRQAELEGLEARIDAEDVQEMLEASNERRDREIETFVREQQMLLREWHGAADVSEDLRETVRARAHECGRKIEELSWIAKRLADTLGTRKQTPVTELGVLRKGRGVLRSYTGEADPVRDIDRQA